MITGHLIAEVAALVGEPARATMLSALLDGRALTASELAFAARVTPQTASTHLAKLTEAGLLSPNQGWATSVFPACITESRRDARWHRGRCA
jgi:DNA-binding transcriptional ArsR family regulator